MIKIKVNGEVLRYVINDELEPKELKIKEPSFWESFGGIGKPEKKIIDLNHNVGGACLKFYSHPCMAQGYAWKPKFENNPKTPLDYAKSMGWSVYHSDQSTPLKIKVHFLAARPSDGKIMMEWSEE